MKIDGPQNILTDSNGGREKTGWRSEGGIVQSDDRSIDFECELRSGTTIRG